MNTCKDTRCRASYKELVCPFCYTDGMPNRGVTKRYTAWSDAKARVFDGRVSGPLVTLAMIAVVCPVGVLVAMARKEQREK